MRGGVFTPEIGHVMAETCGPSTGQPTGGPALLAEIYGSGNEPLCTDEDELRASISTQDNLGRAGRTTTAPIPGTTAGDWAR
ncbi:hypothetical protein J6590_048573 [Homalodisca vitripennis]|nr:hypothetical protein J6590_048573 [Homalodisca vitripennis]